MAAIIIQIVSGRTLGRKQQKLALDFLWIKGNLLMGWWGLTNIVGGRRARLRNVSNLKQGGCFEDWAAGTSASSAGTGWSVPCSHCWYRYGFQLSRILVSLATYYRESVWLANSDSCLCSLLGVGQKSQDWTPASLMMRRPSQPPRCHFCGGFPILMGIDFSPHKWRFPILG